MAHCNLGIALVRKGQVDEAIACYVRPSNSTRSSPRATATWALRCDKVSELGPKDADARVQLGLALLAASQIDVATAEFRAGDQAQARRRRRSTITSASRSSTMGKLDEAVAAHRNAVRLDGEHAGEAIFALGELLRRLGRYDEAIETLRRATGPRPRRRATGSGPRADLARARVGHMKAIVARPPALIGSEHVSKDGDRGLTSAVLRYDKKQFGLAAQFYADAFCAQPRLAGDLKAMASLQRRLLRLSGRRRTGRGRAQPR